MRISPNHAAWILLVSCPLSALAQGAVPPSGGSASPQWSVVAYLGGHTGGPRQDLEAAMVTHGWDYPNGGCGMIGCFPESPNPSSESFAAPLLVSVQRQVSPRYRVGVSLGQAVSGGTTGRSSDHIDIEHRSSIAAGTVSAVSGPFHVSIGPALLRTEWLYWQSADRARDRRVKKVAGGATGGAGAAFSIGSHYMISVLGEYRLLQSTDLEPFQARLGTFPAVSIDNSHGYFAVGLGYRM